MHLEQRTVSTPCSSTLCTVSQGCSHVSGLIAAAGLGDVVEFKRTSPNASTSGSYPDVKAQIAQQMVIESRSWKFDSAKGTLTVSYQLDPYVLR